MDIRQSDLGAFGRCAQQKHLIDEARAGRVPRPNNLSRTVFGTVMHHAAQILETLHAQGDPTALDVAISTFVHYWNPENLPELGRLGNNPELIHGIDEWIARDTHGGLRTKGIKALQDYYALLRTDDGILLALELNFRIPVFVPGTEHLSDGGHHVLTGTVDRVAIRKYLRKPYISIEDFKTGKEKTYLRHNIQWTVYSWASLQPEFWVDFEDANERYQLYKDWPRRGKLIDLRQNKIKDTGWRGPGDYARMYVALAEYVKSVEAGIYPLTIDGEVCTFCDYRSICGGVPVPDEDEGRPT